MFPLHPDDRLRLAEDHARMLRETRPRRVRIRPLAADRLRVLAAWLDPAPPPPSPSRRASALGVLLRR